MKFLFAATVSALLLGTTSAESVDYYSGCNPFASLGTEALGEHDMQCDDKPTAGALAKIHLVRIDCDPGVGTSSTNLEAEFNFRCEESVQPKNDNYPRASACIANPANPEKPYSWDMEYVENTPVVCNEGFISRYNFEATTTCMRLGYYCMLSTPTACVDRESQCEPVVDKPMEYWDRHNIFCPAGKMLREVKMVQAECAANERKFQWVCCDEVEDTGVMQFDLNQWCLGVNPAHPYARRDIGRIDSQNTPSWRCYNPNELNFDVKGTGNCIDDCGELIDCYGTVNQTTGSTSHSSRNIEITAHIAANMNPSLCTDAPTAEPTAEPTAPTAEPTGAPTAEPTAEPTGAPTRNLTCGNIPEYVFDEYWTKVGDKHAVKFNDKGEIRLRVKGTSKSNIILLLADSSSIPASGELTESTSARELFIGGADDPVIHSSECAGCAPDASNILDVAGNSLITTDDYGDIWVSVSGQVVNVGTGTTVNAESTVYSVDYNASDAISVDTAILTYSYDDPECQNL